MRLREYLARFEGKLDLILLNQERLIRMSTTISQQQDTNTAAITTDLATIKTGVATLQAQLAAAQATAGETITQAQEDALSSAKATADSLAAVFNPPASTVSGSGGSTDTTTGAAG